MSNWSVLIPYWSISFVFMEILLSRFKPHYEKNILQFNLYRLCFIELNKFNASTTAKR